MNKKNLFLGLTVLLCANQASASWFSISFSNPKVVEQKFMITAKEDLGFGILYRRAVEEMFAQSPIYLFWALFINHMVLPYILEWKTREPQLESNARWGWSDQQLIYAYNMFNAYVLNKEISQQEKEAMERMAHTVKKIWIERVLHRN
jgi:hypothetical protein